MAKRRRRLDFSVEAPPERRDSSARRRPTPTAPPPSSNSLTAARSPSTVFPRLHAPLPRPEPAIHTTKCLTFRPTTSSTSNRPFSNRRRRARVVVGPRSRPHPASTSSDERITAYTRFRPRARTLCRSQCNHSQQRRERTIHPSIHRSMRGTQLRSKALKHP